MLRSGYSLSITVDECFEEEKIQDDFLGMMYACCHAELTIDAQITFILKLLCGFSTKEVARAFLCNEDTISKRIYRVKEFFRKNKIRPAIPNSSQLPDKTDAVLQAIYMLFNEGYCSTHTDELIRRDLISQAMLLCQSLIKNESTKFPEVYALMALMCFHTARTDSRFNTQGELILLAQQDRSKWNQDLIASGNYYMSKSAFGNQISNYHVEAAISYEHCSAASYHDTNWTAIIAQYDYMQKQELNPIISLNRSLALLELEGAKSAQDELQKLEQNQLMQGYYLYHAAWGEVYARQGKKDQAISAYQKAQTLTQSSMEKKLLDQKIASVSWFES